MRRPAPVTHPPPPARYREDERPPKGGVPIGRSAAADARKPRPPPPPPFPRASIAVDRHRGDAPDRRRAHEGRPVPGGGRHPAQRLMLTQQPPLQRFGVRVFFLALRLEPTLPLHQPLQPAQRAGELRVVPPRAGRGRSALQASAPFALPRARRRARHVRSPSRRRASRLEFSSATLCRSRDDICPPLAGSWPPPPPLNAAALNAVVRPDADKEEDAPLRRGSARGAGCGRRRPRSRQHPSRVSRQSSFAELHPPAVAPGKLLRALDSGRVPGEYSLCADGEPDSVSSRRPSISFSSLNRGDYMAGVVDNAGVVLPTEALLDASPRPLCEHLSSSLVASATRAPPRPWRRGARAIGAQVCGSIRGDQASSRAEKFDRCSSRRRASLLCAHPVAAAVRSSSPFSAASSRAPSCSSSRTTRTPRSRGMLVRSRWRRSRSARCERSSHDGGAARAHEHRRRSAAWRAARRRRGRAIPHPGVSPRPRRDARRGGARRGTSAEAYEGAPAVRHPRGSSRTFDGGWRTEGRAAAVPRAASSVRDAGCAGGAAPGTRRISWLRSSCRRSRRTLRWTAAGSAARLRQASSILQVGADARRRRRRIRGDRARTTAGVSSQQRRAPSL